MIEFLIGYLLIGALVIPFLIVAAIETDGYVGLLNERNMARMAITIIFQILLWPIVAINAFT